jgi:hypothetical protein
MRIRLFVPIALLALGAVLAPACSSDDGDSDASARTSEERDNSGNSDSGDSDSDSAIPDLDDITDSIPDLDDITDSIPGLGDLEGCIGMATAYGSLYLEALGGEDGARDAKKTAEELKDELPSDLHDDIDVIADAIGQIASDGLLSGSEALDTPEYKEADAAVSKYLQEECGG